MKRTRSLELRIFNYFLLITIAAIMIGIEFYFELSRTDLQSQICTVTGWKNGEPDAFSFSGLKNKIMIMFGVLSIVAAIVLLMFVKTISMPIQRVLDAACKINDGDLRQIIEIETHDEIGQLGMVINDLTSNFQELAASALMISNKMENQLDALKNNFTECEQTNGSKDIELIRGDINALKSFIESFDLLATDVQK